MEGDKPQTITLLHFNDAYNIQPNKHGKLGFLNFYEFVQRQRKKYPESLLIFSGDCFAPSKLTRIHKGHQMEYCINKLGIDVACYGNHDFDFPPEHTQELVKDCKFPWLLGNVKYVDTGKNLGGGLSYHIIEHNGVKIGFLGLAGPDFCGRLISCYKDKLRYINIKEHAKLVCEKLKMKNCQLIIALNHCRRPVDEDLAKNVPQIDLILGGHDHHQMCLEVNKIPLLKSGSDFQCLSVVQVKRPQGSKKAQNKGASFMMGRRWNFELNTYKVPKAEQAHPEIEDFIKSLFHQKQQMDKQKSLHNNKPRVQKPNLPQSDGFVEYGYLNNRPAVFLRAGLSTEICFAKYMAFKRKCFYVGYKKAVPAPTQDFVHKMLEYVYKEVIYHQDSGQTVLYSPGICNVPYLVETCNFVYLPSHFLVGVTRIGVLQETLRQAIDKGYKCYAVLGYDPFFQTQLCAWIKFTEPPPQYIKIIEKLKIKNVVMMSVHDPKGDSHGDERNSRLLSGSNLQKQRKVPEVGDIYINFIKEDEKAFAKQKQIQIFGKIIEDRDTQFWLQLLKRPKRQYIHDWQSGIDCIDTLHQSFQHHLPDFKVNYFKVVHPDSWVLYTTAYHLGKDFIGYNYRQEEHQVRVKGLVFNQYIMSNPTYQLNYGYLPVLYWQFYDKNQERIMQLLSQEQKTLKRWFNMHKGTHLRLVEKDSKVLNTDHMGKQLGLWVTKHAPTQYKLRFLPFQTFLETMNKLKLLIICV